MEEFHILYVVTQILFCFEVMISFRRCLYYYSQIFTRHKRALLVSCFLTIHILVICPYFSIYFLLMSSIFNEECMYLKTSFEAPFLLGFICMEFRVPAFADWIPSFEFLSYVAMVLLELCWILTCSLFISLISYWSMVISCSIWDNNWLLLILTTKMGEDLTVFSSFALSFMSSNTSRIVQSC